MKRLFTFIFSLIISTTFWGQEVLDLHPTLITPLDFSPERIQKFNSPEVTEAALAILDKMNEEGKTLDDLSPEQKEVFEYWDETKADIWDIIGGGCSWYCGTGAPKKITASSYLKSQGDNTYEPQNAHDLSYKNAWVEGVPGYGIGEYLVYHFHPAGARITDIIIVNGYVKSEAAWKKNSRVKKLKMYINDELYAILNLKDTIAEQRFSVDPIGEKVPENRIEPAEIPDRTLKFEILDVYKGSKYDDVVITEIYFDGLDVHCFPAGTKITMGDHSLKNIEALEPGDSVITYDPVDQAYKVAFVEKLEAVLHHNLVRYIFEDGDEITATQDHPFLLERKGWSSLKPEKSAVYNGFEDVQVIETGDYFKSASGKAKKLVKVEYLEDEELSYTISKLSNGNNFVANGFVVGVEELPRVANPR